MCPLQGVFAASITVHLVAPRAEIPKERERNVARAVLGMHSGAVARRDEGSGPRAAHSAGSTRRGAGEKDFCTRGWGEVAGGGSRGAVVAWKRRIDQGLCTRGPEARRGSEKGDLSTVTCAEMQACACR